MSTYSSRQIGAALVGLIGLGILGSGLLINEWTGRLWKGADVVNFEEVLRGYFVCALVLGSIVLLLARRVGRDARADGLALLFLMVSGAVLADRLLLVRHGLPLWRYHPEIHYEHRPSAVRTGARDGVVVSINRYGHHDDDFPLGKPPGEFRALMLGDSVTMGFGVGSGDTFSDQLEVLLEERDARHQSHQIINAGVHGYSTYHERYVLERDRRFDPDLIVVGFCMNDVTEPFVVDTGFGGVGLDYHGVSQTPNPIAGYLINETGVGRLLQRLQSRSKSVEREKRVEVYNVEEMVAQGMGSPKYAEAWNIVLDDMTGIYQLAAERDTPVLLLVFPFTFQLLREDNAPLEILSEHAAKHGVDVIDFTAIFRDLVFEDEALLEFLGQRGYAPEEIERFFRWRIDRYFFDQDHFTREGHGVVARELLAYLERTGMVELRDPPPAAPSPQS